MVWRKKNHPKQNHCVIFFESRNKNQVVWPIRGAVMIKKQNHFVKKTVFATKVMSLAKETCGLQLLNCKQEVRNIEPYNSAFAEHGTKAYVFRGFRKTITWSTLTIQNTNQLIFENLGSPPFFQL